MALKKIRTLPALKVNPGLRASYRRALDGLLAEMARDVVGRLLEEYDRMAWRIAPEMAQDGKWRSPAQAMLDAEEKLLKQWRRRFRDESTKQAKKALRDIWRQIKRQRTKALKDLGISVSIDPSRLTQDRFKALLLENVRLIRTIPEEYFSSLSATINHAIVSGFDRAAMAAELFQKFEPPSGEKTMREYRKWQNHCRFIARDQTSKAVQALAECTDRDLGLTEGIWVHVPGRLSSRLTHIKMNGTRYKLDEGLYDSAVDRMVKPASEINCMCSYRPVIPDSWRA